MTKNAIVSQEKVEHTSFSSERKLSSLFMDLKSLLKGIVLIANVLPVITGFWLAIYFTNASFSDQRGLFLLTMIGSTFVMAGALVLNNWYEVDLDREMERTKNRPTVTGNFSLKTVLTMGIIFSIIGFVVLYFTTMEAVIYAFIGWFTYVIMYTMWMKRKYTLNTVMGSISGAVTPLIGWAALAPSYHYVPIVLALLLFIWQMPHTFAIAMRRHDEYKAAGVAMLPVVRGFDFTKRQIIIYVTCLLPLPFFLTSLGTIFVVIATILNVVWILLSVGGFFTNSDAKWARALFLYSVNYLAILFILMIVVTLPIFS
ncbi:heme o synthase [Sporosarcina ureilytica]|uniref:Protoheme IX farnesyltransferase n=1 Tax=Sporosarcina ureilytica TaxID=298596 RepID=A0A1D8JG47_9BACL|nr:heme o synthase [Sporosarcina ureilytica]AOV07666.1 protoheme IX farnesyltransferase [Sporosarcina ureilytica]